jgi:hypothetical protein
MSFVESEDQNEEQNVNNEEVVEQEADDSSDDSEGEHEQYSARVQKRINELVARAKTAEERNNKLSQEAQDAYNYARGLVAQTEHMQARMQTVDQGYVAELNNRLTTQEQALRDQLKDAYEDSDYGRVADLTAKISEVSAEKIRAKSLSTPSPRQTQQQPRQQAYQPSQPDPKAVHWAQRNPWFGRDAVMTGAAQAVDHDLVSRGIDPTSDFYYQEIDRIMREEFPNKFSDKSNGMSQSVAGVNRNPSNSKKKATLSEGERRVARRLGVTDEAYLKSKIALQRNA